MPNTRKLVDLTIEETSGVDHPAHLHEGWLVRKNETAVLDQALADLDDQPEPDQGTKMDLEAEVTIDAPADDVVVADAEPAADSAIGRRAILNRKRCCPILNRRRSSALLEIPRLALH